MLSHIFPTNRTCFQLYLTYVPRWKYLLQHEPSEFSSNSSSYYSIHMFPQTHPARHPTTRSASPHPGPTERRNTPRLAGTADAASVDGVPPRVSAYVLSTSPAHAAGGWSTIARFRSNGVDEAISFATCWCAGYYMQLVTHGSLSETPLEVEFDPFATQEIIPSPLLETTRRSPQTTSIIGRRAITRKNSTQANT